MLSIKQRPQSVAKAVENFRFIGVMTFLHDKAPADHHVAYWVGIPSKDHRVHQGIACFPDQTGGIRVQNKKIGPRAGGDPADIAPKRPAAAHQGTTINRCTNM